MSENETILDIEMGLRARTEEMAKHLGDQHTYVEQDVRLASRIQEARKRQEETHQKELDALNEQIADLRRQRDLWSKRAAELVEKCNEQYAKMKRELATIEKSSAVGDCAKLPKKVDLRFDICRDIALVIKIGRDYQNKDGYRGAHYDTVKLLCDAIEYLSEQTNVKNGDCVKLREALSDACYAMFNFLKTRSGGYEEMANALDKAKAALADTSNQDTQED